MARQDVKIDIRGPSGHRDEINVFADPSDANSIRDELRTHLAGTTWDRNYWPDFRGTWLDGFRLREVRAA